MTGVPRGMKGRWRELAAEFLQDPANRIVLTGKGHLKWITKDGFAISGWSVSDHRALKNHISHLKRVGWTRKGES